MDADKEITSDTSRENFDAVVAAANSGSADALKDLREILRRNPDIWEAIGNLGEHAENALIGAIAGGSALVRESLKNTCDSMLLEIAGANPGLIRKISVAVCARTIFAAGAAMRMEDVWPVSRLLAVADPGV